MKVTIDRSKWIRGAYRGGSCGTHHCAAGFLLAAHGAYPSALRPMDVGAYARIGAANLEAIITVNDTLYGSAREMRLKELFAEAGHELVFEGVQP